jgi:hypothetical protein
MTAFSLHSETITIWYELSICDVIQPYFFEENYYCNMLQTFLAVELQ